MKFLRILSITTILLFSHNLLAYQMFQKINCPPISEVTHVNLTKATHQLYESWLLTSNEYVYEGKNWSTAFVVPLPNIDFNNESEQLAEGDKYFRSMTLSFPVSYKEDKYSICIYTDFGDSYSNQYVIGAVTPAIHGPIHHM